MGVKKPVRIMHIVSAPAIGGAEIYVRDMAIEAHRLGHAVAILFMQHTAEIGGDEKVEHGFLAQLDAEGIDYGFVGYIPRRIPFRSFTALRSQVGRFKPDIIHAHLYSAVVLCAFAGVPVVYTRHGIGLRVPRIFYALVMNRIVHTYIGICQACTDILCEVSGKRPVVRIDNGARLELCPRNPRPAGEGSYPLVLLAVGRLNWYKNYPLLLDAVSRLPVDCDWELWIAGDGEERRALEGLAAKLGVAGRTRFLGNVTDVARLLAEADVFVMSSRSEGLPIALLEATLAAIPVVVTNVGGCAEVVHLVGNGIVVDEQQAPALASALSRMLQDEELRAFSIRNSRRYGRRYSLAAALEGHLHMYAKVLGGRDPYGGT